MVASRNGKTIYDATDTTVSLISAATRKVTRQIRIAGGEPGNSVGNLVLSPNGKTLYAQSQIGNGVNELVPINTATSRPGKDIRVKCFEGDLVMTPNGKTIYIVCPLANSVIPVHTATGKAGPPIRVGDFPGPIAVTPNGSTVFVGNSGSASVTPISTASNKAGQAIPVGRFPQAIAVTPNGNTAFVASYVADSVTPVSTRPPTRPAGASRSGPTRTSS